MRAITVAKAQQRVNVQRAHFVLFFTKSLGRLTTSHLCSYRRANQATLFRRLWGSWTIHRAQRDLYLASPSALGRRIMKSCALVHGEPGCAMLCKANETWLRKFSASLRINTHGSRSHRDHPYDRSAVQATGALPLIDGLCC